MKRVLLAVVFLVALVPRPAGSALDVILLNAVSAASGAATTTRTAGYAYLRVQACGGNGADAFTGTLSITQGARSTTVVETLALTLTSVDGCVAANYRVLSPSLWVGANYTRASGKLTVYVEGSP